VRSADGSGCFAKKLLHLRDFAGLLGQPHSRDAAWALVQAEWSTLTQELGTFRGIPGIIGALGNFCSRDAAAPPGWSCATTGLKAVIGSSTWSFTVEVRDGQSAAASARRSLSLTVR
jgi:hypothetical protein